MSIGNKSDFKVYQDEFHGGMTEVMMQEAATFNAASVGTINLTTLRHKGDYIKESFFQELTSLISRRDTTSVASVADQKLTEEEDVKIKLNRKIGPVAQTVDSFIKIASDPGEMSFILGQQWGKAILIDYLNEAVAAAVAAFSQTYAVAATGGTVNHGNLVASMSRMGDAGKNVRAFLMHSKSYYDLMGQSISDKITDVAGVTINNGTVASLGRPVIVADVPALEMVDAGGVGINHYNIVALTNNAITVDESEDRRIVSDVITGLENLVLRYQGEYAFSLGMKGYAWNLATGGNNPTSAALATAGNWTKIVTDNKSTGGVVLTTL